MSTSFPDHFSENADRYARSRPGYPDALFAFLASVAPGTARAWDCATGNGQAALGLAAHFREVEATDASAGQVAQARAHPRVRYSVRTGEDSGFPAAHFDAVCVAQAMHWLDLDRFYAEVRRVLRDRGVLLVCGYDRMRVSEAFDAEFKRVVLKPLAEFWPKQNTMLWRGYRELPFPFEPIEAPALQIEVAWRLADVLEYVGTWTAARKRAEGEPGFLEAAGRELEAHWPSPGAVRVAMPLHVRCGRHHAGPAPAA